MFEFQAHEMRADAKHTLTSLFRRLDMRSEQSTNYISIQLLRAIAALMIVIWHSQLVVKLFTHTYLPVVPGVLPTAMAFLGRLDTGVDIFFCISGFIMFMLVGSGRESEISVFLPKRLVRIFPLYWIVTAIIVVVYLFNSNLNIGDFSGDSWDDLRHAAFSFLLIPHDKSPVLGPGWTLEQEMIFYTSISLMLLLGLRARLLACLSALAAVCIVLHLLGIEIVGGKVLSVLYAEFLFGAIAYKYRNRLKWIDPRIFLLTAGSVYITASYLLFSNSIGEYSLGRVALGGMMGFCLLGAALGLENKLRIDGRFVQVVSLFGDASYAIYLSQRLSLSFLGKVALLFRDLPVVFIAGYHIGSIIVSIIFGVILHLYLDVPMQRQLKHLGRPSTLSPELTPPRSVA